MAIAFSNFGSNTAITSGPVVVTVTINAGDTVVVLIDCVASATRTVSIVVDSSGTNIYAQQINLANGFAAQGFIWASVKVGSSATSVTVTMSGAYTNLDVVVLTYTGDATLGLTNSASGSGTTESVSIPIEDVSNFVVSGIFGHNTTNTWTFSASVGNLRAQKAATNGTSFDGVAGVDNTSPIIGTISDTTTSSRTLTWVALALELRSMNAIPVIVDRHRSNHSEPHQLVNF